MTEHLDQIPDDLPTCQERLRAVLERLRDLERQLHDMERQLEETCSTTEELQRSYSCLKEEYLALKRLFFGPRRERLPEAPGQQHLFDADAPPPLPDESTDPPPGEDLPPAQARKGHGRQPIPDDLPRRDVLHDVPQEERTCGCGRDKARIGEDVTEQLEYEPGKLFVFRHIYPKYACSCCKDGVTSALPGQSDRAGPARARTIGLRLGQQVLRALAAVSSAGRSIPPWHLSARSTMCGWLAQCAHQLRPLVELMREQTALVAGDQCRRDPGAGAGSHAGFDADRILLGLYRRQRSSLRGLRLPRFAEPRRAGRVPQGLSGLFADGCLCILRVGGSEIGPAGSYRWAAGLMCAGSSSTPG